MSIFERLALEAYMEQDAAWKKQVSDLLTRMAAGIEALEDRVKLLEMADATATAKDERRSFTEALAKRTTWNGQSLEGTFVTFDSGETLRGAPHEPTPDWSAYCHCPCDPCFKRGEHPPQLCPVRS